MAGILTIEHRITLDVDTTPTQADAIALWYSGVMLVPRALRHRHVAVLHQLRCVRKMACCCVPLIVRAIGGEPS